MSTSASGCPHARGGGPPYSLKGLIMLELSPRTWGWTWLDAVERLIDAVVPTHVGVDRCQLAVGKETGSCPHARGGGPTVVTLGTAPGSLSPRTWGCTWISGPGHQLGPVVPTHVGVDPNGCGSRPGSTSCPHARGGGPPGGMRPWRPCALSPRTWGWTAPWAGGRGRRGVVPTHVGVDRRVALTPGRRMRCPLARGGGLRFD